MSNLIIHYERPNDPSAGSRRLVTDEIALLLKERAAVTAVPNGRELHGLVIDSIHDLVDIAVEHDWTDVGTVEIESKRSYWKLEIRLSRDSG